MHKEVLPNEVLRLFRSLKPIAKKLNAVLAGGTALALQIGHRMSADLDFFSLSDFSNEAVISQIRQTGQEFHVIDEAEVTLSLSMEGTKVSFFKYDYPFTESVNFEGIPLAGTIDIAAMKTIAIIQRGTKRDFVDLFFVLQEVAFAKITRNMVDKFGQQRLNPVVMGKALVYFTDADSNPDPNYVAGKKVGWERIKKYFRENVKLMALELDKELRVIREL